MHCAVCILVYVCTKNDMFMMSIFLTTELDVLRKFTPALWLYTTCSIGKLIVEKYYCY